MESDNILVSVYMLTFNHEKYIRKAIDSVLMQKVNFEYELVIGDDASTDGTKKIIQEYARKYPNTIRAYCRTKNIGALNNSISIKHKCRGKYLACLEGDDYWNIDNKLQLQVDFLESHPEFILCYTDVKLITDVPLKYPFIKRDVINLEHLLNNGNGILAVPSPTIVFRNIYKENPKLFNYYKNMKIVGDRLQHTLLIQRGKFKYIPIESATYRYIVRKKGSFSSMPERVRCEDTIQCFRVCKKISGPKYNEIWNVYIAEIYKQLFTSINCVNNKFELMKVFMCKLNIIEKYYLIRELCKEFIC